MRSLSFIFLLTCLACSGKSQETPKGPPVALVENSPIFSEELAKAIQTDQWKFGDNLPEAKQQVLENLIKTKLLLQEADKKGIKVDDAEIDQELEVFKKQYQNDATLEKTLQSHGLTLEQWKQKRKEELILKKFVQSFGQDLEFQEEELKLYFKAHKDEFEKPEQIRARQIVTDSREKAEGLRKKLQEGADFADLANSYSLSPDRSKGGDLGYFARGTMPPAFDQACFELKQNEISPVIQTIYGYHLFQLLDRKPAKNIDFAEAKPIITEILQQQMGEESFANWYHQFRDTAEVKVDQKVLANLLITQQPVTEGQEQ